MENNERPFVAANQIKVSNPREIQPVYSNEIGASTTKTDFRLFFTEIGTDMTKGSSEAVNEIKAIVTLPTSAAEPLIALLQFVIANRAKANESNTGDFGNVRQ